MTAKRKLGAAVLALVAAVVAIQLLPYGRQHANPPDGLLTSFDSPVTKSFAKRACFDCHSNRTRWPWYASIAPISWRIQHHVDEGREALNFTAFDPTNEKVAHAAGEAGETVVKGEMPPNDYLLMHAEARLTSAEKEALRRGLDATFAAFVREREAEHRRGNGNRATNPDGKEVESE